MNYRKLIIRAIFAIVIIFIIALGIMCLMDRNKEHNTDCGYPIVTPSTPRNVSGLQSIYAFSVYYERSFTIASAQGTTQHYEMGNGIELPNDTASRLDMYNTLGGNPALVSQYSDYIRNQSPISTFLGQGPTVSNRRSAIEAFINLSPSPLTPSQYSDPVLRSDAGVQLPISVANEVATACASGCGSTTQFNSNNCPSSEPSQQVTYVRGSEITLNAVRMSSRWYPDRWGSQYIPDNLIDGSANTIVTTDGQPDNDLPWVSARILGDHLIGDVLLTNRPHVGYQYFLGHFGVWLSNIEGDTTSSNAKHCGNYTTDTNWSGPFTVNCDGEPVASGNWVTVKQISGPPNSLVSGLRYLTPSKLEVYIAEPSTTTTPVTGCRNDTAANYNPAATVDGNCIGPPGTTLDNTSNEYLCDAEYMNAGSRALVPNGTVTEACGQRRVRGCMITTAANYNAAANVRDDNSCIAPAGTVLVQGSYVCPYNTNRFRQGRLPDRPFANTADGNCGAVRVRGCTNSTANNYNADANVDDNSCIYSNTDTNFGRNANEQAVYNDVNINGCLVATDISSCTGVKINVNRNVTNNENGASRTLVRHLCCQDTGTSTALENARNAETTLNSAHRTAKTTVGGYSSLNGQTYNNTTSVFF